MVNKEIKIPSTENLIETFIFVRRDSLVVREIFEIEWQFFSFDHFLNFLNINI